jgi:hypothetical protein
VRAEIDAVLERSWIADEGAFVDKPGDPATVRAWCDAIELAAMLRGEAPPMVGREASIDHLAGLQDPVTGALPPAHGQPEVLSPGLPLGEMDAAYSILCVGYALELLGSQLPYPIREVSETGPHELAGHLDALPWERAAWNAGAWVDSWGSAIAWQPSTLERRSGLAALLGWLTVNCDPLTGMWGAWSAQEGRRQMVNGFYRAVRGTFAQFGLPVPYPTTAVDTALAHAADARFFGTDRGTACDVLDVTHTFWLCRRQGSHRAAEVEAWAAQQLERICRSWWPREGFSFELSQGSTRDHRPGLQGTEMWLATAWLLADLLGVSQHLGYTPQGIHRPEPSPRATDAVGGLARRVDLDAS